jgi:putative transposase
MPRIARALIDGAVYHILNRGNGSRRVFHKDLDYKAFLSLIEAAKSKFMVKIFAYCLMPNHFHMVTMPSKGEDLSRFMQWLMTSHVRRYHQHYGTSGHIWQGRFKSFIIQKDNHLITVLRYVEGNPLRAELVISAKDWLWSSHRERIGLLQSNLIDEIPIELPSGWSKFVDEPITIKELEKLYTSVNRQAPYGLSDWQIQICRRYHLGPTVRQRGRPKKKLKEK